MKSINMKKMVYGFLIVGSLYCSTSIRAEEKKIEVIKKEAITLLKKCQENDLAARTERLITELEEAVNKLIDTTNNDPKSVFLGCLQNKLREMELIVTALTALANKPTPSKHYFERALKLVRSVHKSLGEIHNVIANYNNSTNTAHLMALGLSLEKYEHLLPSRVRNLSLTQKKMALAHRFKCS